MATSKLRRAKEASVKTPSVASHGEGLDTFDSEAANAHPATERRREALTRRPSQWWPLLGLALVGSFAAAAPRVVSGEWGTHLFADAPNPAKLTLNTTPTGASVAVNGETRGTTPLSLTLAAGKYSVTLTSPAGHERTLEVSLGEGQSVVQQVEWTAVPTAAVSTGALQVQTEPPGAVVVLDDERRGTAPLTIPDLPEGTHRLLVTTDTGSYRREVVIKAGETLSVVVAPQAPAVSAGFLRVISPVLLQLRADSDLVGNSESERVMLPAGEHELELVNDALGFRRTQRVRITAGRTTDVRVEVPNGLVSINAVPWAEVWLNDERLGDTPLANISRPIGTYRVTLRHPQFGERRATITVSARETARLGVDMRQPQ